MAPRRPPTSTPNRRKKAPAPAAGARDDALIDASPLATVTLDLEGRVRSWNPAAERLFGWSGAEVLGRKLPIVPPELFERSLDVV